MKKKVFIDVKQTQKNTTYRDDLLSLNNQKNILNLLYFNENDDNSKNDAYVMKRELKNKINGYKQQDKKNKCLDNDFFISLEEVVSLLISSRLKCYYCKNDTHIIYNDSKQPDQWTLDRIDNDQGHNRDNCVISCLKCNLDRKTLDSKKFLFTKQMKIIKKE